VGGSANVTLNPTLTSDSNSSAHTEQTSQQSNSQTTNQNVGVTTGSQAGGSVSGVSSSGGAASIQAPSGNAQVTDNARVSTLVLPNPAMAAQLPGGFCTAGKSMQLSFVGIGYGSSASAFDAANYEKCIKVAEAMRSKLPHEVATTQCQEVKLSERVGCIKSMMEAMTTPDTLVLESKDSQPAQSINISPTINLTQPVRYNHNHNPKKQIATNKPRCARIDPACQVDTCVLQYSNCKAISLQQLIGDVK
jgi:hypothetical protein